MLKNLEHYVQVLKIEKNHSSNTIDSYLSDIKSFEKYLVKRKISFKKIVNEAEIIQKYFKYLNRSKISPTSIKRKYSSLSSYFSYLIDRKIIKKIHLMAFIHQSYQRNCQQYYLLKKSKEYLNNQRILIMSC